MDWDTLDGKGKSPPIPRKERVGRSPSGKKPRHGRRNSTRIHVPTESDNNDRYGMGKIYSPNNQRKERGRSKSTRDGGNESDASRFSQDCLDGEAVKRGRQIDSDKKRKAKQKRREEQKKQQTIEQLKASQGEKDSQQPECINVDDHEDDRQSSPDKSTFDGVRTDRATNVQKLEYVNRFKGRYPGNDNSELVEVGEDRGNSSKRNKKKLRGRNHDKPAMAGSSLSPHGAGPQKHRNQGGRRIQDDVLNQSFTSDDPLDQARQEQATNRPRSSSKSRSNPFSDFHPNRTKTLNESRRGKSEKMTKGMGTVMDKLTSTASHRSNHNREKHAEAAIIRQTAIDHRGKHGPSSGEKRRSDSRDVEEGRNASRKKQRSPKGSSHNAIDVDHSIVEVDGDDGKDDNIDITNALGACGAYVGQEQINHLNEHTSRGRGGRTSPNPASGKKGLVSDMNAHLQKSKPKDIDIEDSPDGKGIRGRGRSSADMALGGRIPKKSGKEYGSNGRANAAKKKSGFAQKVISQGGLFNDPGNQEEKKDSGGEWGGEWLGRLSKPIGKAVSTARRALSKTPQKKKKSPSPKITEAFANQRKTRRRSQRAKAPKRDPKDDIIEIDDSSEEEDDMSVNEPTDVAENVGEEKPEHKWAPGDRRAVDAVNIAIGKKMVTSKCEVSVQTSTRHPYIQFSGVDPKGNNISHKVLLNNEELKEIKYFIANDETNEDADESLTMIAFRITPTEKNGFTYYPNKYHQDDSEDEDKIDKYYVSVEVRDPDALFAFVTAMEEHPTLKIFCEDAKLPSYEVPKYAQALIDHQRQERNTRLSVAGRTRSGGNKNKKKKNSDNKLLLVYPFGVDESILDEAASELTELGGDLLGVHGARHNAAVSPGNEDNDQSDGGGEASDEKKGKSSRTHYVTIREDDVERLSPGQFLNDTLVDFWMRWISRGEPADSNVHFFTSHFMTTLKEDGPEAVASWTAKKKINIFEKKFIFIPVNADLHWSLCVVVNPGLIANNTNTDTPQDEDHACIFFLDSLRMHKRAQYARHIRTWLNFEWKRQKKGSVDGKKEPFDKQMVLRSPKIPYQENGCDCGVFVCRYAYSLYTMRHLKFTYDDMEERFSSLITKGPAFQFGMSDIARIRDEIETLIANLSKHYLQMKEEEEATKRARRKEKASKKAKEELSPSESSDQVAADASKLDSGAKTDMNEALSTSDNGSPEAASSTSETTEKSAMSIDDTLDAAVNSSDVGNTPSPEEDTSKKDTSHVAMQSSYDMKENISNHEGSQDESEVDNDKVSPLI